MPLAGSEAEFSGAGDKFDFSGGSTGPAPEAPTAPAAPETPTAETGKIQDDPTFRSLPRDIQKLIESGEMDLAAGVQAAAQAGGGAGAPAPQVQVDNAPAEVLDQGPQPVAGQQTTPNVPQQFGRGPERLTAGQALEGGRTGRDTFARPGQQGFRAFAGQEFNPFLLRNEAGNSGAALSARDALQTGDVGRSIVGGGVGGADPFLKDLL